MRRRAASPLDRLIVVLAMLAIVALVAPLVVAAINSFGDGVLAVFPPKSFSVAAYQSIPARWPEAIGTSVAVAGVSSALAVVLGTAGAWGLARGRVGLRLRLATETLLRSPVQVPALVSGVSFMLLYILLRNLTGWNPQRLGAGLVLAHAAYTLPFVLAVVGARLASFDWTLEDAALGLGASRTQAFFRVTFPVILPAVVTGALFAFLISFDNLPLSLFLVGAGVKLFPVELFNGISFEVTRTIYAVATLVAVATSLLVLVAFRSLRSAVVHAYG
jgi:ABC-type spermidine/putrescine transport system permease subunit II